MLIRRLELHVGNGAFGGIGDLKELPLLEVEHPRNDVGRERLNFGVEVAHHGVVVTARILQRVFQLGERLLQRLELGVGLQVGIGFGNREQIRAGPG